MSKELVKNVQEPVAYRYAVPRLNPERPEWHYTMTKTKPDSQPLYASRKWVGLDDDEVHQAFCHAEYETPYSWDEDPESWCKAFYNYVEAKLREKNQ